MKVTKVFRRGKLRVELDREEINVIWEGKCKSQMYFGSYECAANEGVLAAYAYGGGYKELTDKQCDWLHSLADKLKS